MTELDAIAAAARRWSHSPVDHRDVEERLALRLGPEHAVVLVAAPPVVRLFVAAALDDAGEPTRWRSAYVHSTHQVDAVLDRLRGAA